jgi:hypothetical protein
MKIALYNTLSMQVRKGPKGWKAGRGLILTYTPYERFTSFHFIKHKINGRANTALTISLGFCNCGVCVWLCEVGAACWDLGVDR